MKVEFLSGFEKDISLTRDKVLAKIILECIGLFEKAECFLLALMITEIFRVLTTTKN